MAKRVTSVKDLKTHIVITKYDYGSCDSRDVILVKVMLRADWHVNLRELFL